MDLDTVASTVSITAAFIEAVGKIMADLERREVAAIDIALLNLTRQKIDDEYSNFKANLPIVIAQEKAKAEQELRSRNLGNTTVLTSKFESIDCKWQGEAEKASRECARRMEEVALKEQMVNTKSRSWRKRFIPWRKK